MIDRLLTVPQYLVPHHALSRLVGRMTRLRNPWIRDLMIRSFIRRYGVDLSDALVSDPAGYPDFNAFFTRALAADARRLPDEPAAVACPVDGKISQIGAIEGSTLIQAKGTSCTVQALLGDRSDLAASFQGGSFAALYLAPRDYHRIHMPVRGRLSEVVHVPGALFSVNDRARRVIDRLFARNERVVMLFDAGERRVGVVMIGAMFVGSIEMTAGDLPAGPCGRSGGQPLPVPAGPRAPILERGEELARFNMGSAVILLFERGACSWRDDVAPGDAVRMGQTIGVLKEDTPASR